MPYRHPPKQKSLNVLMDVILEVDKEQQNRGVLTLMYILERRSSKYRRCLSFRGEFKNTL